MDKVRFFAHGKDTDMPCQRATDFWYARCPSDVILLVQPDEVYDAWVLDSYPMKATVGVAYVKRRLIVVPLRTLKEPRWGLYLEHELLHLEHPDWDEDRVRLESYSQPFGSPTQALVVFAGPPAA